jgi:hypothetical protein
MSSDTRLHRGGTNGQGVPAQYPSQNDQTTITISERGVEIIKAHEKNIHLKK